MTFGVPIAVRVNPRLEHRPHVGADLAALDKVREFVRPVRCRILSAGECTCCPRFQAAAPWARLLKRLT
jgi:hypothetical protein